jgi:hypothetical protein
MYLHNFRPRIASRPQSPPEAVRRALHYGNINMLKTILLTAALFLPGLAYGANPSATLSVQVVPAGQGNTCGTPLGDAAAAVAAAGFNTCALFSDFTASTGANWVPSFPGPVATTSNWLNCNNGSAVKIWYVANGNSPSPTPPPCTAFAQVTDTGAGGNAALDIQYLNAFTRGDAGRGTAFQPSIITCNRPTIAPCSAGGSGLFPITSYYEATYRVVPNPSNYFSSGTNWDIAFWGWGTTNTSMVEIDHPEEQTIYPVCALGVIDWAAVSPTYQSVNCPFDLVNYHTYGVLVTGTQAAMSMCMYFDGVKQGCVNFTPTADGQSSQRRYLALWNEPKCNQTDGDATCAGIFNEIDMYIKSVKVFTCAGWATTATGVCNGNIVQ